MSDLVNMTDEEIIDFGTYRTKGKNILISKISNLKKVVIDEETNKIRYDIVMGENTIFTYDEEQFNTILSKKIKYDAYISSLSKNILDEKKISKEYLDKHELIFNGFINDSKINNQKVIEEFRDYLISNVDDVNNNIKTLETSVLEIEHGFKESVDSINNKIVESTKKIDKLDITTFIDKINRVSERLEEMEKSNKRINGVLDKLESLLS